MTDLARYVFSTVRVVPNPATGEFANVAAIVGSDETGEWAVRGIGNEKRARQFCGHYALMAGHDFVSRIGLTLDLADWALDDDDPDDLAEMPDGGGDLAAAQDISEEWLRDLARHQRHVVQLSEPSPILATSADEALDVIFRNVFPEAPHRQQNLNKRRLLTSMKRGYTQVGLEWGTDFVWRAPLVAAGPSRFTHSLDYIVRDEAIRQIVQMWSFQVGPQTDLARDVKAWGWTMREMREHGGSVIVGKRALTVPSDVEIDVVVAPPTQVKDSQRYDEALAVFDEFGATVFHHGDELQVAERAVALIGSIGDD